MLSTERQPEFACNLGPKLAQNVKTHVFAGSVGDSLCCWCEPALTNCSHLSLASGLIVFTSTKTIQPSSEDARKSIDFAHPGRRGSYASEENRGFVFASRAFAIQSSLCTSSTARNDDPLRTKSSDSLKRFSSRSPSENRSAASEKIGVKASITCVRYSSSHFRSPSVSSLPGISRSLRPLAIILCRRHSWLTAFGTSGNGSPARRFSTSLARKSANGPMSSPTLAFSSEAM